MANWIKYLKTNNKKYEEKLISSSSQHNNPNDSSSSGGNKSLNNKFYHCKKKQSLKYLSPLDSTNSHHKSTNEEENILVDCSSRSSSSIPSLSLSDDDTIFSNRVNYEHVSSALNVNINSASSNQSCGEEAKTNENLKKMSETVSENKQLKQSVSDLKLQLQNAEEMNSQLASEIEAQTNRINNLNKLNDDIYFKFTASQEENENFRKSHEQSCKITNDLTCEVNRLNTLLREVNFKLDENDALNFKLSTRLEETQDEITKLSNE